MRSHSRLVRMGMWLATTSLSLSAMAPALAQPAPPPGADQPRVDQPGADQPGADQPGVDQAGEQGTNPPALAGRLAGLTGAVSFHAAGETQWNAATLNYPVTNGEAFWTEPKAQARLEIADDLVVMDASTELDVTALDQGQFAATEAQGAIFVQLNSLPSGQTVTFATPRGAVQITATGRYEIVAGDTNDATTVTVVEGAAHVSGTGLALDIGPQQTATIGGSDTLQGSVGAIQQDAFLQSMLRAPARPHFAAAVPQQVQYMTGAADLQTYGSFSQNAQYGQIWYPREVARNWAPYRDGHWAYVQPWGWTWVDNARWGFAPFHYGRWVQVDNRWGWVAGGGGEVTEASPYPVYSPALVSFVGVGAAALTSVSIGFGAGEIGGGYAPAWIPLGPREPYYPWYHCRPDYFGRINTPYGVSRTIIERGPVYNTNVTNVRIINNNRTVFINQRAATVIPAAAFARGASVASLGRPLPERALLEARPVEGRLPVRPTAQTANLPPAAARRYNVALPTAPIRPVTAGPRIVPVSEQARSAPALRQAALPANVHGIPANLAQTKPGQPGATLPGHAPDARPGLPAHEEPHGASPAAPAPRAGAPLPALRAPGAARPVPAPLPPSARRENGPAPRGEDTRPGAASTQTGKPGLSEVSRRGTAMPAPSAPHPLPQVIRPSAPVEHHVPAPVSEPRRMQPSHVAAPERAAPPRAMSRQEAPRPEARPAPARAEQPRPAPRVEAPRPAPRIEAPRPAPRMEAPRPAPHAEAPRPAPHPAALAPRPAAAPGKHPPG